MIIVSNHAPQEFAKNVSRRAKGLFAQAAHSLRGAPLGARSDRMLDDIAFRENVAANQVRW